MALLAARGELEVWGDRGELPNGVHLGGPAPGYLAKAELGPIVP